MFPSFPSISEPQLVRQLALGRCNNEVFLYSHLEGGLTMSNLTVEILRGTCFCRSVSYTLSERPLLSAYCHCTNCQRLKGALAVPLPSPFGADGLIFQDVLSSTPSISTNQPSSGPIPNRTTMLFMRTLSPINHIKLVIDAKIAARALPLTIPLRINGVSGASI